MRDQMHALWICMRDQMQPSIWHFYVVPACSTQCFTGNCLKLSNSTSWSLFCNDRKKKQSYNHGYCPIDLNSTNCDSKTKTWISTAKTHHVLFSSFSMPQNTFQRRSTCKVWLLQCDGRGIPCSGNRTSIGDCSGINSLQFDNIPGTKVQTVSLRKAMFEREGMRSDFSFTSRSTVLKVDIT